MMMTTLRRTAVRAVLTTGLMALASLGAAPAEAAPVAPAAPVAITCGAVLHQDAYLAADLTCPIGNGVTVAASLSIDLQGHHLTGSRSGVGITIDYPANVKVTHGRLTGWGTGLTTVLPEPVPQPADPSITVIAVTFLDNGTGIAPGDLARPDSIYAEEYTVFRSWFVGNDVGAGGVEGAVGITVSGATFRDNQVAISQEGDAETDSGYLTLADSELSHNRVGVYCYGSLCDLQRNSFSANPTAVQTDYFYTNVLMTGNTVTGSAIAVDLHDTSYGALEGNTFTGNNTAVSYYEGGGSVRDNVFASNGKALTMTDVSIYDCGSVCPTTPISGNRVSNNTGDGIVITDSNVSLKNNISTFNHGWGINTPGAEDQGGNIAFGNYRSPQCVGVVCTH